MNSLVSPVPDDLKRGEVGVLVVHDEEVVHWGWRLLLSRERWSSRCFGALDVDGAVDITRRYDPAVAVVDLDDLGHERTGRTTAALLRESPSLRILLLAGRTAISPKGARYLGASGVVEKTRPAAELAAAVLAVASGERVFAASAPRGAGALSTRERQVLTLMADGSTNREVAGVLQLSNETVKQHAAAIYRKLRVRNRTEAAQRGRELGLLLPVAA